MEFDAIIVGARIAGASTALLLAQRGYSVLLLDRDRFPSAVLSTHLFFTDTLKVFERIGVLDQVLATDAPRLKRLRFPYVDAPFPEDAGRDFALCIRRESLDIHLVEAAAAHDRIDVRTGTRVTGLIREGERVVGVRFRNVGQRTEHAARARIVIGADGLHSVVAREVGAEVYDEVPPLFAWYYGYFRDVPLDDPPSAFAVRGAFPAVGADYSASFIFPTDGGLTLVGFGVQHDSFARFKQNYRTHFLEGLRSMPAVMERLGDAEVEGSIVGTGDLPNLFRVPSGPGWALVGDAGCHKDPHTIQGIGDAARSAVFLAEALDSWWRGDLGEDAALRQYQERRDVDLHPMYDFTTNRLQSMVTEEDWQAFADRTWEDPVLAERRVAAITHTVSPAQVYSPEAIRDATTDGARPS